MRGDYGIGFSYYAAASDERPPERRLADLMLRELESPYEPAHLRAFIQRHWSKVSMLAHQIHDTPDDPYVLLQAGDG